MVRKNPLSMTHKEQVEARVDIEKNGVCPECVKSGTQEPMPIVKVNGVYGYVCEKHCICLPVENGNEVWKQELIG